jgi:hypothetical protein
MIWITVSQCCGSGMFYPGSRIRIRPLLHSGSGSRIRGVKKHRIPDPGGKKAPDPGSRIRPLFYKFCLLIPDPGSRIRIRPLLHPGSGSRIRGVKKHRIPDPTSFLQILFTYPRSRIPDPDPTIAPSRIRIPDPGGKKAPDPGSGSATLLYRI